jgi:hypothetical protein
MLLLLLPIIVLTGAHPIIRIVKKENKKLNPRGIIFNVSVKFPDV